VAQAAAVVAVARHLQAEHSLLVEQEHLGKVPMVAQEMSVADQHLQIFDAAVVVVARLLPETAQAVAVLQRTAEPAGPGLHIQSAVHQ
jgi:hypothetical protein